MIRNRFAPPPSPATILAEFPRGACAICDHPNAAPSYWVSDGFGNTGRGASWDDAAESLRIAQCAHAARLDALDREAARNREAAARRLAHLAIGAAAVALLIAGALGVKP